METFGIKLTASNALKEKYGFSPAPQQITLLESDGEGDHILFRVGDHEYRCDGGVVTNMEDQKRFDDEVETHVECALKVNKVIAEFREERDMFATKEKMLIAAYNAKQMEIEDWERRLHLLQTLADGRREDIGKLEVKVKELMKEIEILKNAVDLLKKYRKNCSDQQVEINSLKNEQRFKVKELKDALRKMTEERDQLKAELEEREAERAAVAAARRTAAYWASRLED